MMLPPRRHPGAPPAIPSWDTVLDAQKRADLAAGLIFTTEPTDRALEGWSCWDWAQAMLGNEWVTR